MLRYTDAKRRRTSLYEAIRASGEQTADAWRPIWDLPELCYFTGQIPPIVIVDYPAATVLADQLRELRAACQDLDLAQQQLTEAGIDLR